MAQATGCLANLFQTRRAVQGLVLIVSCILLGACATQRPADEIRASGDWLMKRGEWQAAADEYQLIVDRYGGDWQAHHKLALCSIELGDQVQARRSLEIAYNSRPNDAEIVEALARVMYMQGDESRLYAFLRQRAEAEQSVEAYMLLGSYAVEMGDADTAKVAYETAIAIDGGQTVEPYLEASQFAGRIGDMDLAVHRLRQAYAIDPRDARVRARLRSLGEVPGPTLALPHRP